MLMKLYSEKTFIIHLTQHAIAFLNIAHIHVKIQPNDHHLIELILLNQRNNSFFQYY